MVCIYCHGNTDVTNSRPKARNASVWRRRSCRQCVAQFTTIELPDYATAFAVKSLDNKNLQPFLRDKLYLSLNRALGHRKDALVASTELTTTVIGRLIHKKFVINGTIDTKAVGKVAYEVLKRFDPLAASSYKAYHQAALRAA